MNGNCVLLANTAFAAFLVGVAADASAQGTRGFAMGSAAAVTTATDSSIRIKDVGFTDFKSVAGTPDFTTLPLLVGSKMLAMSIGLERITITEPLSSTDLRAFLDINTTHGWVEIMFTVNPDEVDEAAITDADLIKELGRDELAGGLFSHVWSNGDLPLADEEDSSTRVVGASESKVETDDLVAVDFHLSLYANDDEFALSAFLIEALPTTPTLFFTVDLAHAHDLAWFDDPATVEVEAPSAATVLKTTWNGSSWGTIEPEVTYAELGVAATAVIDGLSIEASGNTVHEMLFSFRKDTAIGFQSADDEILYADPTDTGMDGTIVKRQLWVTIVPSGGGAPTSSSVGAGLGGGLGIGDFCERDPGSEQNPPAAAPIDVYAIAEREAPVTAVDGSMMPAGAILPGTTPGTAPLSVAGWRAVGPSGTPVFVTFVAGPKAKGTAFVQFGFETRPLVTALFGPTMWYTSPEPVFEVPYGGFPAIRSRSINASIQAIDGLERIVAQWWVEIDSTVYAAPLLTLNL